MKQIDLTEWSNWIDGQDVLLKMQVSPRTLQRWRINGLLPYFEGEREVLLPEVGYPRTAAGELQWES